MLQSHPPLPLSQQELSISASRISLGPIVKIKSNNLTWPVLVGLLLVLSAAGANAQSGRRQKTPEPAAPIPTPTPEPTPPPKREQKEPEIMFLVGADRNRTYEYYPETFYDVVVQGCAEALSNSSAGVDASNRDFPRGEAIRTAKNSAKTYVVLLELTSMRTAGSSTNTNYDQIEVEYVVFTPGTGKVATSGRTYQNVNRAGPLIVGAPTGRGSNSALYREALLKRAGEDAGERILKSLHLTAPRTH